MLLAQYYDRHMMDAQDWGWGIIMMIFFTLLITAAILFIVKSTTKSTSTKVNNESPLDIAKSRYAKGEITKVQFNEIKKELE